MSDGVWADPDGILAVGDLLRRQSEHVAQMSEYLQRNCHATGAFDGVLLMFRDAFSQAFGFSAQGLQISRDANQTLAGRCVQTAGNYEASDRASHAQFSRLAQQQGWDVTAYRPTGSGNSTASPGACYAPKGEDEEGGPNAFARGIGQVDQFVAPVNEWGMPLANAAVGAIGQDTVMYNGKPMFEDDFNRMNRAREERGLERVEADVSSFDARLKPMGDRLDAVEKFVDPVGALKSKILEAGEQRIGDKGLGQIGADPEKSHLLNQSMQDAGRATNLNQTKEHVGTAMDAYGTVKSFSEDWTMGMKGSWNDMTGVIDDNERYEDIARSEANTSMRDVARGGRSSPRRTTPPPCSPTRRRWTTANTWPACSPPPASWSASSTGRRRRSSTSVSSSRR